MSLRFFPVWTAAILLVAFGTMAWTPLGFQPLILSMLVCLSLLLGILYLQRFTQPGGQPFEPFDIDSDISDDLVDPWLLQRKLMEASDQRIARSPALTNVSVLYAALKLEEGAETLLGMEKVLNRLAADWDGLYDTLSDQIAAARCVMEKQALAIRKTLASAPQFEEPLTSDEAVEIFDGTIDETVVNCGFALASGFDGSAGYAEIVGSNLSKRNPETGKIEKTPDGKWIKGPNYRAPNLVAVMRRSGNEPCMSELSRWDGGPAW